MSRIYAGIHFLFSDLDGLASGQALGAYVLQTFALTADTTPPQVVLNNVLPGAASKTNVIITGVVTDNLSGVAALDVSVDGGGFAPLSFDPTTGTFSFTTGFATDGSQDGSHTVDFQATDVAGNVATPVAFTFTLGTKAPALSLTNPTENGDLAGDGSLTGTVTTSGPALTMLNYALDGGPVIPVAFNSDGSFSQALDLSRLVEGNHLLVVTAMDAAGNKTTQSVDVSLSTAIPLTVTSLTPSSGSTDVGVTFRPTVTFSRPIDVTTLTSSNFFATDTTGAVIPATIVPSDDGTFAWLFFTNPLPGSSTITINVNGSTIKAADGSLLDAAGDGTAGSTLTQQFTTVSTAALPGTTLSGIVADPGADGKPGTTDDVKPGPDGILMTADDIYLNPIANATVYILGDEQNAVQSGPDGSFALTSVPAGDVKLVIDGTTATNAPSGDYYPEMVFNLTINPGVANTVMGSMGTTQEQAADGTARGVYLPRLQTAILKPAGGGISTTISLDPDAAQGLTPAQFAGYSITVAPDSLVGMNGQKMSGGMVGFSTVAPALIRPMLPQGIMQLATTLTIQAPGVATFSTPLQVTFANVYGAAPGSQLSVYSFNHTTGLLEITGTATISPDGQTATTDPGSGITHPGWFGVAPGTPTMACPASSSPSSSVPSSALIAPDTASPGDFFTTQNLHSYFFTDDTGKTTLVFKDSRPMADIMKDPVRVTILAYGENASDFLVGLPAILGKPQVVCPELDIPIIMKPMIPTIKSVENDELYGVRLDIFASLNSKPSMNLITDVKQNEIFIYRYLDAADDNHSDATLEFPPALADGVGKVLRQRLVQFNMAGSIWPTFQFDSTTNFDNVDNTFVFDPTQVGKGLTTTVHILTPITGLANGNLQIGQLKLLGEGTPQFKINVNIADLKQRMSDLAYDASKDRAAYPDLDAQELALISDKATQSLVAQDMMTRLTALFAPYSNAIQVENGTTDAETILVSYSLMMRPDGRDGESFIDNRAAIEALVKDRNMYSTTVQDFVYSMATNRVYKDAATVFLLDTLDDPTLTGLGNSLTAGELANALADVAGHEVGHTLGANESDNPNDLMATGLPLDVYGTHSISPGTSAEEFEVGLKTNWTPQQAQTAIGEYMHGMSLNNNTTSTTIIQFTASTSPSSGTPEFAAFDSNQSLIADSIDFGSVPLDPSGSSPSQDVLTLLSFGTQDVVLSKVTVIDPTGTFAVAPIASGTTISVGSDLPLQITFDPRSAGIFHATLSIESNDPGFPSAITLTGFGLSPSGHAEVEVANNNVGGQVVGAGPLVSSGLITISNDGAGPLSVTGVSVTRGAGEFSIGNLPQNFGPDNPIVVAAGASVSLDVSFQPSAAGLQRGTVQITTDDPENPVVNQPIVGTGLASANQQADVANDYVAVETLAGSGSIVLRERTDQNGNWSVVLPGNTPYYFVVFDPITGLVSEGVGVSSNNGVPTDLPGEVFEPSTANDTDGDGLPDDVEFAVGTSPTNAYSAGDGIDDFTHVIIDHTNPTGLVPLPTGTVSSVFLAGGGQSVTLEGSLQSPKGLTAYVTTGTSGLAIVDASQFQNPVVLSQLQLPGNSVDVDVDTTLQIAAVASTSTLNLVDVSDPTQPRLIQRLDMAADTVKVFEGVAYVGGGNQVVAVDVNTGAVLASESFTGGNIDDLAIDQGNLYVLASEGVPSHTIYKIVLNGATLNAPAASLTITGHPTFGQMHLTAANGYIYVGASDNNTSQEVPGVEVLQDQGSTLALVGPSSAIVALDVAINGTGLALFTSITRDMKVAEVGLLDLSDPTQTGQVLAILTTPSGVQSVAMADGLGFAAESGGLAILNYLPFDTKGIAPTASISLPPAAITGMDGSNLQVVEGSTIPILASVSDDVQVKNVQLLVNGQEVENAVSAPFNLSVTLPTVAQNGAAPITIQVLATDTGGNVGYSNTISVELEKDTSSPRLAASNVPDGATVGLDFQNVILQFSKPLAESTVTPANFQLIGPGGVTLEPTNIEFRNNDITIQLTFPALASGTYQFVIDAPLITDREGNALGAANLTTTLHVAQYSAVWKNPNGGDWSNPNNWDSGVVPGPTDNVLIDITNSQGQRPTITFDQGTSEISSLLSRNPVVLAGGTLQVDGTVEVDNTFTLGGGTLADAHVKKGSGTGNIVAQSYTRSTLDNDYLDGNLDVNTPTGASVTVENGLILNGTASIGQYDALKFTGVETLGGTGSVALDDGFGSMSIASSGTLTVAPGMTINGLTVFTISGGSLINEGTIAADNHSFADVTLQLGSFENLGSVSVSGGGILSISGITGTLGNVSVIGAGSQLIINGANYSVDSSLNVSDKQTLSLLGTWTAAPGVVISASQATINLGTTTSLSAIELTGSTLGIQASYPYAQIQPLLNTGDTLVIGPGGVLDNTGGTITLDSGTGNLIVAGGTLKGGAVSASGGALVDVAETSTYYPFLNYGNLSSTLDGVTLDSDLTVSNNVNVADGLTLNGTATVFQYDAMSFQGSQSLAGSGDVLLSGGTLSDLGSSLTIAPGMTIHGSSGGLNGPLINQGTINSDSSGGSLTLEAAALENTGTIEATNGGGLTVRGLSGSLKAAVGSLSMSGAGSSLTIEGSSAYNASYVVDSSFTVSNGQTLNLLGTWSLGNGTTITVNNGTLGLGGSAPSLAGISLTSSTLELLGTYTFAQLQTLLPGNQLIIGPGGVLDNTGGTINLDAGTGNLIVGGGTLEGGTVTATGGAEIAVVPASTSNDNSTLDGVTLSGSLDLSASEATLTVLDGLTVNGTVTLGGPSDTFGSTLSFEGSQTLAGTAEIVFAGGPSESRIQGDYSTLTIGPDVTIHGQYGSLSSGDILFNQGTIEADATGNPLYLEAQAFQGPGTIGAENGGAIQVTVDNVAGSSISVGVASTGTGSAVAFTESGNSLVFDGTDYALNSSPFMSSGQTLDLYGTWTVAPDLDVSVNGGTLGLGTPGDVTQIWNSAGSISMSGGTIVLGGSTSSLANLSLSSSTLNVQSDYTFAEIQPLLVSGDSFVVGPSGVLGNSGSTIALDANTGNLILDGGTISGGTVTTADGTEVSIGVDSSSSTMDGVTLDGNLDLTTDGATLTILDGLTLNGTATIGTPTDSLGSTMSFVGSQTLGGTGDVLFQGGSGADQVAIDSGSTLTIGTGITVHGSSGTIGSSDNDTIMNDGAIVADVSGGTLTVNASTLQNEGTVMAQGGASLVVNGQDLDDASTSVDPTSQIAFNGGLFLDGASVVTIGVQGTATGQFGSIAISGGAYFSGTLNVTLDNGYIPQPGDTDALITFDSGSNQFATVNVSGLPSGIAASLTYDPADVTLLFSSTASPGTAVGRPPGVGPDLTSHASMMNQTPGAAARTPAVPPSLAQSTGMESMGISPSLATTFAPGPGQVPTQVGGTLAGAPNRELSSRKSVSLRATTPAPQPGQPFSKRPPRFRFAGQKTV